MAIKQNAVELTLTLGADAEQIKKDGKQIGLRLRGAFSTERGNTGWINATAWGGHDPADFPKGRKMLVQGTLGFDQWRTKDDEPRQQVTLIIDNVRDA